MSKTTVNRIRDLDLFAECTRSQLAKIDQLGVALVVAPGRALCVEGAPGAEFFVLVEGLVDVRTSSGTVALLRPGAWFGEAALIDNMPRRATVTARSESMLIVFGRREFNSLLAVAPLVRERIRRSAAFYASEPGSRRTRVPAAGPAEMRLRAAGNF